MTSPAAGQTGTAPSGIGPLTQTDLGSLYQYITGRFPQPKTSSPLVATSLPTTTGDGIQTVLTDSLSAPSFYWTLTYNAAAAVWMFTGGPALLVEIATSETQTFSATYGDLATVGPSFTAPAAGTYDLVYGARMTDSIVGACYMSPNVAGAGAADADAAEMYDNTGGTQFSVVSAKKGVVLAASGVVKLQYRESGSAGNGTFSQRWLSVSPVALTT